jgi:MFS family permease
VSAGAVPEVPIESDLRRILGIQGVRAFLYGFGAVVLGSVFSALGFSELKVGVILTAILAGMALSAVAVGLLGDRIGRRRTYRLLLIGMGVVGAAFAVTRNVWILVLLALTGVMSTDANENGPLTTLEQAMIGQAPAESRVHVFGRYNAVAYLAGAIGALAAGGPAFVREVWHSAPTTQAWLWVFPIGAVICLVLASGMSQRIELLTATSSERRAPLGRSKRTVFTLAGLFAIDSFAGGFVVTTFVVFWFEQRFGVSAATMSAVIFAAGLLQAASSMAAARVAGRFGLLNTMVFTHLPSNVLLAIVPLMPTAAAAAGAYLARSALSQMDVPTRQAYVTAMVDPEERTAAAATTNSVRYLSRPLGPLVGTALMTHVAVSAPFLVAGGLKSVYDLTLYRVFRHVPLPDGRR